MNSIERCDPVPFESDDSDDWSSSDRWIRFPVCNHPDGMQAFFDVRIHDENETFALAEAGAIRLLCHALVQHLPDEAFREAVEALTGMYEFYRNSPALPALPQPQTMKAKLTGNHTAPVFPITEE